MTSEPNHRVSIGAKVGYGVGQVGGQIFRDTPAVLLSVYMITVMGTPPWMAGLAIFLPKFWVIVCDPLVGAWSDRLNLQRGRRPFILAGAISTTIGFVALFAAPDFPSPWLSAAYITVMFALSSTAFSLFSVPYLSMASELSDDPHERTSVLTWRMAFAAFGVVLGSGVALPLVQHFGGGRGGFLLMAVVIGAIMLVTMLFTWFATRTIRFIPQAHESMSLWSQAKVAMANRPFRILAIAYVIQNLGSAFGYSVFSLVFIYIVNDVEILIPFMALSALMIIVAQPPWLAFSRRFGKRATYIASTLGWALTGISWMFVKPDQDVLFTTQLTGAVSSQDCWLMVRSAAMGVFNSGFALMGFSMLTDTVEHNRTTTGQGRAGVFSGVFMAIEKLSFALGPALAGVVMSALGFAASKTGAVDQTPLALLSLKLNLGALPAAMAIISVLIILAYRIPAPAAGTHRAD